MSLEKNTLGAWEERQRKKRRELSRTLIAGALVVSMAVLARYCTSDNRYYPVKKDYEVDYTW